NLISTKDTSICNNTLFTYTALSSANNTSFKWTRDSVTGISNKADSGSTAEIRETLLDTSSLPVVVTYRFTLTTGDSSCITNDSLMVTVYPTPKIKSIFIRDSTFCNGDTASIYFSSASPDSSFTWTSSTTVGFGTSGSGSIPSFTATNTDTT